MMRGQVSQQLEAVLPVTVIGPTGKRADVRVVIDTGFNGTLVLPIETIAALGLLRRSGGTATLADGTTCFYDNYSAQIEWNGAARGIVVSAVGSEPLAGTRLFLGYRLTMDIVPGGVVDIVARG
jgi:clan AA aspartic protease